MQRFFACHHIELRAAMDFSQKRTRRLQSIQRSLTAASSICSSLSYRVRQALFIARVPSPFPDICYERFSLYTLDTAFEKSFQTGESCCDMYVYTLQCELFSFAVSDLKRAVRLHTFIQFSSELYRCLQSQVHHLVAVASREPDAVAELMLSI